MRGERREASEGHVRQLVLQLGEAAQSDVDLTSRGGGQGERGVGRRGGVRQWVQGDISAAPTVAPCPHEPRDALSVPLIPRGPPCQVGSANQPWSPPPCLGDSRLLHRIRSTACAAGDGKHDEEECPIQFTRRFHCSHGNAKQAGSAYRGYPPGAVHELCLRQAVTGSRQAEVRRALRGELDEGEGGKERGRATGQADKRSTRFGGWSVTGQVI